MNRGYSLVELLLVLATLSAVGAVAAPSLSSWRSRHIVTRESLRLQRALERAHTIALLREIPVTVSSAGSEIIATSTDNLRLFAIPVDRRVNISFKNAERPSVTLYTSHTATPSTIAVSGARDACSVIISLRGRTRRECSW